MYPNHITIENYGPYKGRNSLELSDTVYAIVAQHENNPDRSNWIGKSTFLGSIRWALFGVHTWNVDDDLITEGEKFAKCEMTLSSGARVMRAKERGKPVQIEFDHPDGRVFTQRAAQDAIEEHIGMAEKDFSATCFYEQKKLARMVEAQSAERIKIVEAWLADDLEPLQAMHEMIRDDLSSLTAGSSKARAEKELILEQLEETRENYSDFQGSDPTPVSLDELPSFLEFEQESLNTSRKQLDDLEATRRDAEKWEAQDRIDEKLESINIRGLQLKKSLESIDKPNDNLEDLDAICKSKSDLFRDYENELNRLQSDNVSFCGTCPINGKQCPSSDWVCETIPSESAIASAEESVRVAKAEYETAIATRSEKHRELLSYERLETELNNMRSRAQDLIDASTELEGERPDVQALNEQIRSKRQEVEELASSVQAIKRDINEVALKKKKIESIDNGLAENDRRIAMMREGLQLVGRTGAQQVLSQRALAIVEDGANASLRSSGIDLSVSVRWKTKASGLAKHCDDCGRAFSSSQKVKMCPCGATRGQNHVAKLVIDMSDRSGAAEDLAGIAVGLSASVWLRAKRTSPWSAVFIDEPFGSLDLHNKRALSTQIATMISRGFSSAFVVAHDRSILDSLPGRITITGTANGSVLES